MSERASYFEGAELAPKATTCNHVFAYGSLIWNPGFAFISRRTAVIKGYHRALCVYSRHYRGSHDKPGLVLGLDKGGSCRGMIYEVEVSQWPQVLHYIRVRELITGIYREVVKPVTPQGESAVIPALTYVVDKRHPQYAVDLSFDEVCQFVAQGHGQGGSCKDYVKNTAQALSEAGIADPSLEKIAQAL